MAFHRTEGATLFLSRSLALQERDAPARRARGFPAGYEALAVVSLCLVVVVLVLGAFWAGRMVEQRSQLGQMLALAPALEDLTAATRQADSLAMRFMLQLERRQR